MKQYTKNGVVKARNKIVIIKDDMQILNPTEEMVLADGWVEYTPTPRTHTKSRMQVVQELVTKQWNERTDISNEEACDYAVIVYEWGKFIGQELPIGKIVSHDTRLWRVRQMHIASEQYPPSLDTAALYEIIEKAHEGTLEDPIPYAPPMELFEDKYYTEDGIVYRCTRGSDVALAHSLSALVGLYIEAV